LVRPLHMLDGARKRIASHVGRGAMRNPADLALRKWGAGVGPGLLTEDVDRRLTEVSEGLQPCYGASQPCGLTLS
jgi:hypothetical protein